MLFLLNNTAFSFGRVSKLQERNNFVFTPRLVEASNDDNVPVHHLDHQLCTIHRTYLTHVIEWISECRNVLLFKALFRSVTQKIGH